MLGRVNLFSKHTNVYGVYTVLAVIKFVMSDEYGFIETVRSRGTLRTIKHVISNGNFEEEDIVVVRVLHADTQYQQDIAHLVVEDEHPEDRGKKGHPLNVFILGDFPQKDTAFHEGELIALGGGRVSENDKGKLELVFTNDKENIILRQDFRRCNKEDVFSKTVTFPTSGRRLANENLKTFEKIKKWIECGLVAAVPEEITLNEASLKTLCRCNLVCKVLKTRELIPCLGVLTVSDGSICRHPVLTINEEMEVEFVMMNESNLSVDIIVTLKTDTQKYPKEGSYIRLFGVQSKTFSLPLSERKDCIIFKIDGRIFSFESLVGSDREKLSKFLRKRDQHNTTADVSRNIADNFTVQSSIASSSDVSFTVLTSGTQENRNTSHDEDDDDSQSILKHTAPLTKKGASNTKCKFSEKVQTPQVGHKQNKFSGKNKRELIKEQIESLETYSGDSHDKNHRGNKKLCRLGPTKSHKASNCCTREISHSCTSVPMPRCVQGSSNSFKAVATVGQCIITERPQCETHALVHLSREESEGIKHDSVTGEECAEEEPLVIETRAVVRRLKYLPSLYHVNVWIKDVSPTLLGCPLDLITARCYRCKREQSYTRVSKQQPHSEQQICVPCSTDGTLKFLELQFKFTLILWDACDREILASVTGENAEKFLKCSVYTYIREEAIRKQVWNTLRKLKDRGCVHSYRHAQDLIEVDIGVTVEKGIKKYMLLGGVLHSHKQ